MPSENRIDNYELGHVRAKEMFLAQSAQVMADRCQMEYDKSKGIILAPYLGTDYIVDCKTAIVTDAASGEPAERRESIDILHHLSFSQDGVKVIGELKPFYALKGVGHFYPAFQQSVMPRLTGAFAGKMGSFIAAAEKLGGMVTGHGDAAATLNLFPIVPIEYIMWDADDEFPCTANILFDVSITSATHPEDVPGLGAYGAFKLIQAAFGGDIMQF
ncbi:MAG: DUF3786 domain-containing protein [Eubacteriaceae bacterium]|nr:DUF3786 domain-containing protein [Eubacteriaceae bacterium]